MRLPCRPLVATKGGVLEGSESSVEGITNLNKKRAPLFHRAVITVKLTHYGVSHISPGKHCTFFSKNAFQGSSVYKKIKTCPINCLKVTFKIKTLA